MAVNWMPAIFLLIAHSPRPCAGVVTSRHSLHWSDSLAAADPTGRWQLEVRPNEGDSADQAPVVLRACGSNREWSLFTLDRDAEMYWAPRGDVLLVLDAPTADDYQVRLFDLAPALAGAAPSSHDEIDHSLRRAVQRRLGKDRQIQFHLLRFVAWRGTNLIVSVGGMTTRGSLGPMAEYCYGAVVDTRRWDLSALLSAAELAARFNTRCAVSP